MAAFKVLLTSGAISERELVGQSRLWTSGVNRAAMRQLPAAQTLMAVNGRFRQPRRTAPDPELPYAVSERLWPVTEWSRRS